MNIDRGITCLRRREVLKASMMLLGTAASASVSRALLADDFVVSAGAAHTFTNTQHAAIELLSDMIIPPTDTPGAVTAGVPDFIATIYRDWYTDGERESFLEGLAALDEFCAEREDRAFHQVSAAVRVDALRAQEADASRATSPPPGPFGARSAGGDAPFFTRIRELVVLGYYTSKTGATEELVYLPAPGRFDGSYDYAKVGRQFSR